MTLFLLTSETTLRKAGLSETPELTDYKIQTHTIRLRTYSAMCLSVWLIRAQNIFTEKKKMTINVKIASSGLLKTLLALNILLRI